MSTDSITSSQSTDSFTSSQSGGGNSAKRSRNQEVDGTAVDRISDLPESLLLHILSFVSAIYVVRTSVLSRRWQYVWTGVPCLKFGAELVRELGDGEESGNFVNTFLLQYKATSIHKFRTGSGLQDSPDLELWIRWAINRNVEELDLSFPIHSDDDLVHHLPITIFGCKTLVFLKLKNLHVSMVFPPSACIPCLKTLELDSLRYPDYEFESKLISCCVVLENLSIRKDICGYGNDFSIHAQQLKCLKIRIYQAIEYDDQSVIDINAPNLQDLDIEDDGLYSPLLANVGNLSKAKINLNGSNAFQSLLKCFPALKNVRSLHLSSSHIEQAYNLKPELTMHDMNLTHLTLDVGSVWVQLLPYFSHFFPNLEVLKLAKLVRHGILYINHTKITSFVTSGIDSSHIISIPLNDATTFTNVASISPDQKVIFAKVCIRLSGIANSFFYMACKKCLHATTASFQFEFTCNMCLEKQLAEPRCRFDAHLTDASGTITATVFGSIAEAILGLSSTQAMEGISQEYIQQRDALLSEQIHIVQIKVPKPKLHELNPKYTVTSCVKEQDLLSPQILPASPILIESYHFVLRR